MPSLQQQAKAYLADALGMDATLNTSARLTLPFLIKDAYAFRELRLEFDQGASLPLLLVLPEDDRYPGAVVLKKHLDQVRSATDATVVYVSQTLSKSERRSLVGQRINFIQPGFQVFIPELALELREQQRKRRVQPETRALLPAAQTLLLHGLYLGLQSGELFAASALNTQQPYSRVTLGKVMAQLLELGIVQPGERQGAANTYLFVEEAGTTFRAARAYLRSPVKRRVGIDKALPVGDGVFLAGETALASYTDLAEPHQPIYGMTKTMFDALAETAFKPTDEIDEIKAWIEIWAYLSLKADVADEASLLLSLEGNPDERIQIALQTIKEKINWLSGD